MLTPCNCIFFVNSAVLVSVITLSLYVSNIYCQLIFAFRTTCTKICSVLFGHIAGRCFLLEDRSWYAVPLILTHCLLVVYTEGIMGSEYFVVPNDAHYYHKGMFLIVGF